jgi:hypothetical protein
MTDNDHTQQAAVYMPLIPHDDMLNATATLLSEYFPNHDYQDLFALSYSLYITFLNSAGSIEVDDTNDHDYTNDHQHDENCDCG